MKHCVLIYQVVDDYVERRTPFGAEHLALAQAAKANGDLFPAGAFANPVDGALLVFHGETAQQPKSLPKPMPTSRTAWSQAASAGVDDAAGRYGDSRAAVGSALYRAVRMSQSSGNNRTSTILRR
jgi:hypothetical protein